MPTTPLYHCSLYYSLLGCAHLYYRPMPTIPLYHCSLYYSLLGCAHLYYRPMPTIPLYHCSLYYSLLGCAHLYYRPIPTIPLYYSLLINYTTTAGVVEREAPIWLFTTTLCTTSTKLLYSLLPTTKLLFWCCRGGRARSACVFADAEAPWRFGDWCFLERCPSFFGSTSTSAFFTTSSLCSYSIYFNQADAHTHIHTHTRTEPWDIEDMDQGGVTQMRALQAQVRETDTQTQRQGVSGRGVWKGVRRRERKREREREKREGGREGEREREREKTRGERRWSVCKGLRFDRPKDWGDWGSKCVSVFLSLSLSLSLSLCKRVSE